MPKTASSEVVEYLSSIGAKDTFTVASLNEALPNTSRGGISGMVDRLKKAGAIETVDAFHNLNGKLLAVYRVVDLSSVYTKKNASSRSYSVPHSSGGTTTRERMINLLMTVATELERMHVNLSDYSTDELVKELGRRVKGL